MAKPILQNMITTNEARIMLLEQKNDDFHQTLIRIETKIDAMDQKFEVKFETKIEVIDQKFETKFDKLTAHIDSNFKWLLGFMISGFIGMMGLMAHGFHWL